MVLIIPVEEQIIGSVRRRQRPQGRKHEIQK
jgi:hypothetical protein